MRKKYVPDGIQRLEQGGVTLRFATEFAVASHGKEETQVV